MTADIEEIKKRLKKYEFVELFRDELGWDRRSEDPQPVKFREQEYEFSYVAEKREFKIYVHECKAGIPPLADLKQIDEKLTTRAAAHLAIFVDKQRGDQLWLWVKRGGKGGAVAYPTRLNRLQTGDLLAQKVRYLYVSLEEELEGDLTLFDILNRVVLGFDVEKVTKRFYDGFKAQHAKFLGHIKHIDDEEDRKWYTSIMLNRLMFVYFIQRKGLLGNDDPEAFNGPDDYLQEHLKALKKEKPGDANVFYHDFLRPLFHLVLNKRERPRELKLQFGEVPYLNGGIFDVHEIEKKYRNIEIDNEAFESLFDFFTDYTWHLDERPTRPGDDINPDVLGYIFEKYINQKQMGAYYTKEDITGYISKNTIIPFLFEKAAQRCHEAFVPGGPTWSLLQHNPDAYFYEAMLHGQLEALPEEIAAGIEDVAKRTHWNQGADEKWALETETWREVVARQQRYQEVHALLKEGKVNSINDLITYNLNITKFAGDVISTCEDPALLHAFYDALTQVTVLDPTCGSGAFLFAALNILRPLYEACLKRMDEMVAESGKRGKKSNHILAFEDMLAQAKEHGNTGYFLLKSIIVNNLYGVDIMEEAIEICKLRIFLNLVAQLKRPSELEPLPDIDFNVLTGNTLIGFTSLEEVKRVVEGKLLPVDETKEILADIERQVKEIEREEESFRAMQTQQGLKLDSGIIAEHKQRLQANLKGLREVLDPYLATEYGILNENKESEEAKRAYQEKYEAWLKNAQPFHWWAEYYKIMEKSGFDVIIGNPPYVEISDIKDQYALNSLKLIPTGNLYSVCIERFLSLLSSQGHVGVIVPISSISTPRMLPLMRLLADNLVPYISNFAVRPGKLFVGVDMNLTILVGSRKEDQEQQAFSTNYIRWQEANRNDLFFTLSYCPTELIPTISAYPKIGTKVEVRLKEKISQYKSIKRFQASFNTIPIYYHSGGRYFRKCTRRKLSNEYKEIRFREGMDSAAICTLSSSFYYWLWIAQSDCYHVTTRDIEMLPVPDSLLTDPQLEELADRLLVDMEKNAEIRIRNRKDGSQREEVNYKMRRSKTILDEIDRVLAKHYGFTEEELDFIIHYDIKYRMGRDSEGGESEE